MPILLIINGYPGAGKSTASRLFAIDNKFALIKQDYFLFVISMVDPKKTDLTPEDHKVAIKNMHDVAINYMNLGRNIIIEGALVSISDGDPLDVRDFINLGKRKGYKVIVVSFIADDKVRAERMKKRENIVSENIEKMLIDAFKEISGKIEGEIIINTSKKTPEEIAKELEKLV